MKKIAIFAITLFIALSVSACFRKDVQYMDKPAEDGNYHYSNKDLGFSVVLPPNFIYYQTQRKEADGHIDIEFFVPTSDKEYSQEVPGYAKPFTIRIFNKDDWENVNKNQNETNIIMYKKLKEKKDKVYTIKIWRKAPKDWWGVWTLDFEKKITDSFEIK